MANRVVHFEIIGTDGAALRQFYKEAFGWEYQAVGGPMDYALVQNAGIGGQIATFKDPQGQMLGLVQE